ncbi:MAG: hypothetical protein M3Q07_03940 [Pseudobdellovibrionaceae bacterium]|nr:hypothetical protein [Pseudobdellovibrionaceae bacterium]
MTLLKTFIALGLGISLVSCHKDKNDDNDPQDYTFTVGKARAGVSLKDNSPYAADLPFFASCNASNASIANGCPIDKVPLIGERGLPITRDLIKEHTVVIQDRKEVVNAFIDGLSDDLLPLFAKVRMVSATGALLLDVDAAASFGVLTLSGKIGFTCKESPEFCNNDPVPLPEPYNLVYSHIIEDPDQVPDAMVWFNQWQVVSLLCNIADAHSTHDITTVKSRMDANGKIKLNRFSQSDSYPYTTNQGLMAYFNNLRLEERQRTVIDPALLMAGLDDTTDSALVSHAGYWGPTQDFIDTCRSYFMMKTMGAKASVIVLDAKTGKVHKTRKNLLGDAAVKAKLEKMLPIIWADPTAALSDLTTLPAAGELNQDQITRMLRHYQFSPE